MIAERIKAQVAQIFTDELAPALHLEGINLEVLGFDSGVVQVRLQGACTGCASTVMTIIMGLEQELRQRIPEIEYLEAVR
jgi:Fe-S cluster biogenesis protein NfuA